jgi:hypothetical protein
LPRRAISIVLVLCFAGTPSLLLACAVSCVPGMMTHRTMPQATDAATATQVPAHHHMKGATEEGQSSAGRTPHHPDVLQIGTNLPVSSTDAVGPGCCAHTSASATTATPVSRADRVVLLPSATVVAFVTVAPLRDTDPGRATPLLPSLLPQPPRSPLVLRI